MHPFDPTPHIERIPDPLRSARGAVNGIAIASFLWLTIFLAWMMWSALSAADRHYEVRDARMQEHFIAEPRSVVTAWRGL